MENKARQKIALKENKLPTYLTFTGNNHKKKVKRKTTNQAQKKIIKNNEDKNKINNEIREEKNKTEVKTNSKSDEIKIEKKIEKEEYIPYSCIASLESGNDLTINNKEIQK